MPLSLTANDRYHDIASADFHSYQRHGLIMQRTTRTRAGAGVQQGRWYALEYNVLVNRIYLREVTCAGGAWNYAGSVWDCVYVNNFNRAQWWIPNASTLEMIARNSRSTPSASVSATEPNNDLAELRRLIMRAEQRHVQAQASVTNPRVRTWPPITSRTRYRGITEEII